MGLSQALVAAVSGLRTTQAGLSLVAANVANADTPGYTRKTLTQVAVAGSGAGISVRVTDVQRQLDTYVQKQLRTETSGASYADLRSQYYDQIQNIFGAPGADSSLETTFNNFTGSLQALATSPDDVSSQSAVISSAQLLSQQLNDMTDSIQSLRSNAELSLSDSVTSANQDLSQIASLNQKIASSNQADASYASLLDQRDSAIDDLSQLIDINVVKGDNNQVQVLTNSGVQLVGLQAATLSFNPQGTVTPGSQWSADPTKSTLGTITLTSAGGGTIDLVQTKAIRSGKIAALLQLRDTDLVQAQSQLDSIASAMSQALSDKTTSGTAVSAGPQAGFDTDISGLLPGNSITVNYTDQLTNQQRTLTFVRVDDPAALPLSNTATTNPNDKAVGINFSNGIGSVLSQINSALATTGIVASNPSGTTLRLLNGGPGPGVTLNSVSTTTTQTSLTSGDPQLDLFTDGGQPYTGAITAFGSQSVGLAGRISVNAALVADPTKLVDYASGTAAGDGTRPNFIYDQLVNAPLTYSPSAGIGTTATPFSGTLSTYLRQVISVQGTAANAATNLKQGQDVVLSSLQQRFNDDSGVNIDEEMSNLLTLQNAYAANARVLSAVQDMLDTLMKM
jgi:flagellar hook-associated protein 1 FlgK